MMKILRTVNLGFNFTGFYIKRRVQLLDFIFAY